VLEAVPRQKGGFFREVDVMLEENSYRLLAHQVITVSGDRMVHVFDDLKINCPPSDRDVLMKPVPTDYQVFPAEDLLFGKKDNQQERTR
jgi:hypothetical protein